MQWPIIPIKNLTSLYPLIFLSKHISLHALGRLKWVLDIIWPLNQHFNLKNQRNWIKQVLMLSFLIGIICILLHRPKKLTLARLIETWVHTWMLSNAYHTEIRWWCKTHIWHQSIMEGFPKNLKIVSLWSCSSGNCNSQFVCIWRVLWRRFIVEGCSQNLRLINGRFPILSSHFFAN